MKTITYRTEGTCSQAINVSLDENHIVSDVEFIGGCNGNTKGISQLVRGMKAEDVIKKLRGVTCGFKNTSCPDQLSHALEKAINEI